MPKPCSRDLSPAIMDKIKGQGFSTIAEFADANGLQKMTIGRYADLNETHQNLETLARTADALGISIDEFVKLLLAKNLRNGS